MKRLLVLFIFLFPILSFADNKIDTAVNNLMKEINTYYDKTCKTAECSVTNAIIISFQNAYKISVNNDYSLKNKVTHDLLNIGDGERIGDVLSSALSSIYNRYYNTSFLLINDQKYIKDLNKNLLNEFYTDEQNNKYVLTLYDEKDDMYKNTLNINLSLYVLKAYAAYKYNIDDFFKISTPVFNSIIAEYKPYLNKEDYNYYFNLYNEYKDKHNIIKKFFISNYLSSDNKDYSSMKTHEKIKKIVYDAVFFMEDKDVLLKQLNELDLKDIEKIKKSENYYYKNLYLIAKTALGKKEKLLNDNSFTDEDIYLKLRINAIYLQSLIVSNGKKSDIKTQYNIINTLLENNKNLLNNDYNSKKVNYDYYKIYKEYISTLTGDI